MIGRFLNINQVADLLQVSPRTVYRMVEDGHLPAGQLLRGTRRWCFEDIEYAIRYGIRTEQQKTPTDSDK